MGTSIAGTFTGRECRAHARLGKFARRIPVQKFQEKARTPRPPKNMSTQANTIGTPEFSCGAATILDALRQRQPEMLGHLEKIVGAWDTSQRGDVFDREFAAIKPISIDYAVMEHADRRGRDRSAIRMG